LGESHTAIWKTLKHYLAYTVAGVVVLGGVGAFTAAQLPVINAVRASDYSGTIPANSGFAQNFSPAAGQSLSPNWMQRIIREMSESASIHDKWVAEPTQEVAAVPYFPQAQMDPQAASAAYDNDASDWTDRKGMVRAASREIERVVSVHSGDTLYGVLVDAGLSDDDAKGAVVAISDVFSPRDLKAGQEIKLNVERGNPQNDGGQRLVSMTLGPSVERDVTVTRDKSGSFVAAAINKPLTERIARAAGRIDSSLFQAAQDAGLPPAIIGEIIKTYSYDVDFQREVQSGDRFEIVYERYENSEGRLAKTGRMLYAALTLSGKEMPLYYFERNGSGDYYTPTGESIRKSLLRTPVDGAKITSSFGMRNHPILGYTKMHKGVDFGAPQGTPIFAAGNGTVVEIGVKNGYGNYIKIQHNGTYATAYAHASRFAKGLKRGDRVQQGQVIAYVGQTGRATGPHLHYEVIVNNAQVDPKSIKATAGDKLMAADLKSFKATVASLDAERKTLAARTEIAEAPENAFRDNSTN